MPKHADDEPVMVSHSSGRYHGARSQEPEELGYTWGDWRAMSEDDRRAAIAEYIDGLMQAWVEEDED